MTTTTDTPKIAVTLVREVCQWCRREITAGQNPPIWGTCAKCQAIENAWEAEVPCPHCGARKLPSVAGVTVKDGHRDSCITRAEPAGPARRMSDEEIAELKRRLAVATKA